MPAESSPRVRREPPAFRVLTVSGRRERTPYLVRVTLGGPALAGFESPQPAASVRLLLPDSPGGDLVVPAWNGNEFRHADGRRPLLRTLTPLRHDPDELDVDVVRHGGGPLSDWAGACRPGDPVALSGPGRGYRIDHDAASYLLAGDESAMPAIGQLLDVLPSTATVSVIIEVAHPDARIAMVDGPNVGVRWVDLPQGAAPGAALTPAVIASEVTPDTRVWIAGEAAAVQFIRRHLFDVVGISRANATVRGYWKHGRSGDES